VSKQELQRENTTLRNENLSLKEEVASLKRLIFGSKRERFESSQNPEQGKLFEQEQVETTSAESLKKVGSRKKGKSSRKGVKRNSFPPSLQRETTTLLPIGITQEDSTQIGKEVTELLAYRPASLYVKQIIRPRVVDKTDEDRGVYQAPIPPRIVPKGMVDESLIAQIISEKIQFHTPIYRFAKKLKQSGVDFIKENNLHNWFHTGAESLSPLYDLLVKEILSQGYIQADETRIAVLAKNKIGAAHRGQMWAFMAPKLQTDGYSVYETIAKRKDISLSYCMAHARRKFYDAKDAAPDLANYFLEKVQLLYQIEQQCRDEQLTFQQRLDIRQKKAIPILEQLQKWLTNQYADRTLLPKSLIRKAIDYSLSRWKGLSAYAYDGQLEIDNNLVENTIRPIALGRKNYMFAGSHKAAQNLAVLYSIVGTCLKCNINVYKYLYWILKKVAANKITEESKEWLPHRIDPKNLEVG